MSFIGQMFGANNNFQATGVDPAQVQGQYGALTTAQDQQAALVRALQAQNGIANQSDVFQQQQQLAQQLQQQTLGQGPNPAQAQLAQNTAANTAQQAALMASQRGASANAGLTARNASMAGANMQQQATGQAATLQANQQLAAQQALQQQQAQMAGLATNQVGQQIGAQQQAGNLALQGYGAATGALNQQNQINAGVANNNAQVAGAIAGGLLGAGGAAMGMYGGKKMAHGGMVPDRLEAKTTEASRLDAGWGKVILKNDGGPVPGKAKVAGDHPKNDTVPAMLSPGELVIPRSVVAKGPEAVLAFAKQCLEEDCD